MENGILETNFNLGQNSLYKGKVRDVYYFDERLVMVTTDRISAFDVVLPRAIPGKGQVLNQIAVHFLKATDDICPNWMISSPDPMATVGYYCKPFSVEMIVRGYLTGSAWRLYKGGGREICGLRLSGGMKKNQRFPKPIVTPTTKAEHGAHDENISKKEIIAQGLVSAEDYEKLEAYSLALFERGSKMAAKQGLILVDTKYEFGKRDGEVYLIDEVHTPDSSRYFYKQGYEESFAEGSPQRQLSKEFVREWLIVQGFNGQAGQQVPEMSDAFVNRVSERYIELFETITGKLFVKAETDDVLWRIEKNIRQARACGIDRKSVV